MTMSLDAYPEGVRLAAAAACIGQGVAPLSAPDIPSPSCIAVLKAIMAERDRAIRLCIADDSVAGARIRMEIEDDQIV